MNRQKLKKKDAVDIAESLIVTSPKRKLNHRQLELELFHLLQQEPNDADFNLILRDIERRGQWLGSNYPFITKGFEVVHSGAISWYDILLVMSPGTIFRGVMSNATIQKVAIYFEQISELAIKDFLGGNTKTIRFGWPSHCGRPSSFPEAIDWLAGKMNLPKTTGFRSPRRQDGGVDVVAWKPFADGRTACPIMLAQCTIQRDVLRKTLDVDLRNWSTWLGLLRDPVTTLIVPFVLEGASEEWKEIAQRHIIIDRIRLADLLQSAPVPPEFEKLFSENRKLLASELVAARS